MIATVLDEVMVWAIGVNAAKFVYCAELTVRYLRPTRPQTELVARGEVVENRRGKLFTTRGELRDAAGQLLAEATGKYLPVPDAVSAEVAADFVGERAAFLQDGMTVTLRLYEDRPISVRFPDQVVLTITEADPSIKGQTAASSYKPARLENGLRVMVPPFIEAGEKIIVDTTEITYVRRAD